MMDLIGLDDRVVYACVQEIATSRRRPPQTFDDVLAQLEKAGLTESVAALRRGPGAVTSNAVALTTMPLRLRHEKSQPAHCAGGRYGDDGAESDG
ncbi:hypothetical protein ABZ023_31675, partial [Streptomyces sp. NPDC006367]